MAVVDYERLAGWTKAIAAPGRLRLLRILQVPHRLSEIRLNGPEGRPISRQSVRGHLRALEDAGLVVAYQIKEGGTPVTVFRLEPSRLFVLLDTLNSLGVMADDEETFLATDDVIPEPPEWPDGPGMVCVNGPFAGTMVSLDGPGPWSIGRARGSEIHLAYDPFVSKEHARVERRGRNRALVPVAQRNATFLNRAAIEAPGQRLHAGDIIQVGRTRLVYRA